MTTTQGVHGLHTARGSRWGGAARDVILLLGVALVVAAATMLGWQALMAAAALSVLLLAGAWLQYRTAQTSREWAFVLLLSGLLLLPMVGRVVGVNLLGLWQAGVLAVAVLGVVPFMAEVRRSGWLRLAFAMFGLYLALGFMSSLAGRTRVAAGVYQLISDFKPLLLVALGFALRWDERTERWLWWVVKFAWIPLLLLVAFEWAAPGAYFKLLYRGVGFSSADPTGLLPSRAIGAFEHPAFLATMAALLGLLCMGRACSGDRERGGGRWFWPIAMYGLLVVCSVQRQELAAYALALAVIALVSRPDRIGRNLFFIGLLALPLLGAFLLVFWDNIQRELALWGVGTLTAVEHPRAQIFLGAFQLALSQFPLGTGLGTYGGAGAEKFDPSLYYSLGFTRYWWFGKQDFLMDTYWPNPIAEMGFFGAAALLLCYLAMFGHAAARATRASHGPARGYWLAAAGMMVYMLALSSSSPAFQDPRLFALPAIMFGVAAFQSRREAHAQI